MQKIVKRGLVILGFLPRWGLYRNVQDHMASLDSFNYQKKAIIQQNGPVGSSTVKLFCQPACLRLDLVPLINMFFKLQRSKNMRLSLCLMPKLFNENLRGRFLKSWRLRVLSFASFRDAFWARILAKWHFFETLRSK